MTDLSKLTPNRRRGYVMAREFLFSQFFFWGGALVGTAHYFLSDSWGRSGQESLVLGFLVSLLYLPFSYARALRGAWRVWRGHDQPDEITEEQEKAQVEAAQAALKSLTGVG